MARAKMISDAYWPMLAQLLGMNDVRSVRRVVIDFKAGDVPVIHVEQYSDEHLLGVVRSLDGVEIKREETSNGRQE